MDFYGLQIQSVSDSPLTSHLGPVSPGRKALLATLIDYRRQASGNCGRAVFPRLSRPDPRLTWAWARPQGQEPPLCPLQTTVSC